MAPIICLTRDFQRALTGAKILGQPRSALALVDVARKAKDAPRELALVIESDPGLTSQLLRFGNSSCWGFGRAITNVPQAIHVLGLRTVQNFLLGSAVYATESAAKCGLFRVSTLWLDSLRRAIFCRCLANQMKLAGAEDLFTAALLQDMAIPVLAQIFRDEYQALFAVRHGEPVRLSELEYRGFGWNHGTVGALMARSWRLPESLAIALSQHATVDCRDQTIDLRLRVVGMSALLPSFCDANWSEHQPFADAWRVCDWKGDPASSAETLFAQVDAELRDCAAMSKVAQPAQSLVQFLPLVTGGPPSHRACSRHSRSEQEMPAPVFLTL